VAGHVARMESEIFLGPLAESRKLTGGRKEMLNAELHITYTSENRPVTSVDHIKEVEMGETWSMPSHSGGPRFKSLPSQGFTSLLVVLLTHMPGKLELYCNTTASFHILFQLIIYYPISRSCC